MSLATYLLASVVALLVSQAAADDCTILGTVFDGLSYQYNRTNIASCCSFNGITCSNGRVTQLRMSSIRFNGSIPDSIGNLTGLTYIDLSNNMLRGSIPALIGNLSQLWYLDLDSNNLNGSIPSSIGNLTKLSYLNLSFNQLNGSIPVSIGNATSLNTIGLNSNQLTGSIPASIGQLTNLNTFNIFSNNMSGIIPASICNITSIRAILNIPGDNNIWSIPVPSCLLNNGNVGITVPSPSASASVTPTAIPSIAPSATPSIPSSHSPTASSMASPSISSSLSPSISSSLSPSASISTTPAATPSIAPSLALSLAPSATPSNIPSLIPSPSAAVCLPPLSTISAGSIVAAGSPSFPVTADQFNVIVRNNFSGFAAVDGRLLVGGNATIDSGFSVGSDLPVSDCNSHNALDVTLVVLGNLNWPSGIVYYGSIDLGNSYTAGIGTNITQRLAPGCNVVPFGAAGININSLFNQFTALSNSLSCQIATYSVLVSVELKQMTLTGTGGNVEIFNIPAINFGAVQEVILTGVSPNVSAIIINVIGQSSVNITGNFESFKPSASRLIWNFGQITSIQMQVFEFYGAVLAPNAAILGVARGVINGQVIANSFQGSMLFSYVPFLGCLNNLAVCSF